MAINRAALAKQLLPGLNAIFGLTYKMMDDEHAPLFDMETSERSFEEEQLMSLFGSAPTKKEGDAVAYDDAVEAWTARYTHDTVALAFAITEEAIEDNLYDSIGKIKAQGLGRAMANTKQVKAASVYNNGFSTSFPIGDGQPIFSTTHPTVGGGTQSNRVSVDLSETALENAFINISLLQDERGILCGAVPKSLHLPPQLQFVAHRILKSDLQVDSPNNNTNALKDRGLFQNGISINRRFTDANAWFIRTDVPNGFKMFTRVPLQSKMEPDFDTGNIRYKSRERYSFGLSDWRQGYGSSGST
jgi:hypothetical protein